MKKMLFLYVLFIFSSLNAQSKYALSFEPEAIFNQDGDMQTFGFYNLQFSYINMQSESFFLELETGIVLDGFTPHINLYLGGDFSHGFLKAGIVKFFDVSPGQASGPDFGDIFLPSIVEGIYLGKKVFVEVNYMLAIGTIGIGYRF